MKQIYNFEKTAHDLKHCGHPLNASSRI